jgi:hypothetical protein
MSYEGSKIFSFQPACKILKSEKSHGKALSGGVESNWKPMLLIKLLNDRAGKAAVAVVSKNVGVPIIYLYFTSMFNHLRLAVGVLWR